jgi:hypothetical protein
MLLDRNNSRRGFVDENIEWNIIYNTPSARIKPAL